MKNLISNLFLCHLILFPIGLFAQRTIDLIDSLHLEPYSFAFHPDGHALIAEYSRDNDMEYLVFLIQRENEIIIDTLPVEDVNQATFSKGGDFILYNFFDRISWESFTVKRAFNSPENIGPPTYVSPQLGLDNMSYYFMDEDESIYFFTYAENDPSMTGLFYSAFENGRYQQIQQIFANRDNVVAYSPLLLQKDLMLFPQHGIINEEPNGMYYAIKQENKWSEPIKLDGLPFCHNMAYYDENTVAFLADQDSKFHLIPKSDIMNMINQKNK
ncbi:MAG: hypothetical protein AAF741_19275 [Bacteroidota bacterium]